MGARAIVEVRFGPLQGTKALIAPGSRLRVGRTDFAELVVPHDKLMSGEHFELSWDGERCFVKDLGSAKGTRLAGEPVTEAEVEHGGWIRAGGTDFMVHFEERIPAREEDEEDEDDEVKAVLRERKAAERKARMEAAEKALAVLREEARKGNLYAVLDAARDERILQLLKQNVEEYRSLYEGVEGETMAEVAPYLAGPMREYSGLLEALVREGWGRRWGIYCTSEKVFKEVRSHLRRLLMVEDEETSERMYFRFYDPVIMNSFWPTCNERQVSAIANRTDVVVIWEHKLSVRSTR
jgi:pSer/pThr/pTyr-binding forkhead associated (FHA) protein